MTHPPGPDIHYRKKYGALICGVIQIALAFMMIAVGIVKDAGLLPAYGMHAYIGSFLTLMAGGFGIHHSRTGGKCPTVASMVMSILATLVMFSGLIFNSIFVGIQEVSQHMQELKIEGIVRESHSTEMVELLEESLTYLIGRVAEACYSLMVFACFVNFVICIVQSGFACAIVCCGQPTNTNVYLANVDGSGGPGDYSGPPPQPGHYPNMPHVITQT